MRRWASGLALVVACEAVAAGGETLLPVNERFAAATAEAPDFQRHVVPLLGTLGCNGRACHGSFQGQGGFRLSLFGFDFAADHASLSAAPKSSAAAGELRVDKTDPARSLILRKPTLAVDHEGGDLFAAGSWSYRLLERWIAGGARGTAGDGQWRLLRLEVEPKSIVFPQADEKADVRPLRVVARWEDGSAEDVTCLCRFQANDDTVAKVDAD